MLKQQPHNPYFFLHHNKDSHNLWKKKYTYGNNVIQTIGLLKQLMKIWPIYEPLFSYLQSCIENPPKAFSFKYLKHLNT